MTPTQPAPARHNEQSINPHGYAAPDAAAAALPPPPATNPDDGEAQWEAKVQRIETMEKNALHGMGTSGMDVDAAERAWAEQVAAKLSAEAQLLRGLVLGHKMRPEDAEERLGDDYAAAREAARRVDAELNAHGIHPHRPAFPARPTGTSTGNLRGQQVQKQPLEPQELQLESQEEGVEAASAATPAPGDIVGQVVYRKDTLGTAGTAATTEASKTLIATDDGALTATPGNAVSTAVNASAPGGKKLLGMGIAPVAGIAVGIVGLIALAVVGVSKARGGGGGGGQRPTERRVLRVSSAAAGTTTRSPTRAIQHTNFVQML